MISNLRSPIYVQTEITSACNQACFHCYNFWRYGSAAARRGSSSAELEHIARVLGENDIFYVTITGGEPFLEKEKVFQFLGLLREQNIRTMINTNATLITDDDARRLSEYSIETFLVSMMSSDAQVHNAIARSPGAFEKTMDGIHALQKHGISVAVNTVASKLNYKSIYATGKWIFDNLGICDYSATPICPSVREHDKLILTEKEVFEVLNQLLILRKELGLNVDLLEVLPTCLFSDSQDESIVEIFAKRMCTAGNTTIAIGSEGDVRVCSYDQESYGNILVDDFQTIWRRMGKWRDNSLLPHECKNCAVVESCGGGCRVNSKLRTGQYCELDYLSQGKIESERKAFFQNITKALPDSEFSFSKNIFVREEEDGVFVMVANPTYFMVLNNDGVETVRVLNNLGSFRPKEAMELLKLGPDEGGKFFAELFNKGFLVEAGKGEGSARKVYLKRREVTASG